MKNRFKILFLIIICIILLISSTYSWFIYNAQVTNSLDAKIKMWNVEFVSEGESEVTYPIVIQIADLYPGMEEDIHKILIKNKGSLNADVTCEIKSLTLFGEKFEVGENYIEEDIKKKLEELPFKIKTEVDKEIIKPNEEDAVFTATFSWEFEEGNSTEEFELKDNLDTEYGIKAYNYLNTNPDENCFRLELLLVARQTNV